MFRQWPRVELYGRLTQKYFTHNIRYLKKKLYYMGKYSKVIVIVLLKQQVITNINNYYLNQKNYILLLKIIEFLLTNITFVHFFIKCYYKLRLIYM